MLQRVLAVNYNELAQAFRLFSTFFGVFMQENMADALLLYKAIMICQ